MDSEYNILLYVIIGFLMLLVIILSVVVYRLASTLRTHTKVRPQKPIAPRPASTSSSPIYESQEDVDGLVDNPKYVIRQTPEDILRAQKSVQLRSELEELNHGGTSSVGLSHHLRGREGDGCSASSCSTSRGRSTLPRGEVNTCDESYTQVGRTSEPGDSLPRAVSASGEPNTPMGKTSDRGDSVRRSGTRLGSEHQLHMANEAADFNPSTGWIASATNPSVQFQAREPTGQSAVIYGGSSTMPTTKRDQLPLPSPMHRDPSQSSASPSTDAGLPAARARTATSHSVDRKLRQQALDRAHSLSRGTPPGDGSKFAHAFVDAFSTPMQEHDPDGPHPYSVTTRLSSGMLEEGQYAQPHAAFSSRTPNATRPLSGLSTSQSVDGNWRPQALARAHSLPRAIPHSESANLEHGSVDPFSAALNNIRDDPDGPQPYMNTSCSSNMMEEDEYCEARSQIGSILLSAATPQSHPRVIGMATESGQDAGLPRKQSGLYGVVRIGADGAVNLDAASNLDRSASSSYPTLY